MFPCRSSDKIAVVVKGQFPGVAKQSGLFMDKLGHAKKPVEHMASYSKSNFMRVGVVTNAFPVWFAAMVQRFSISGRTSD
jgi:hypothetical protein